MKYKVDLGKNQNYLIGEFAQRTNNQLIRNKDKEVKDKDIMAIKYPAELI